MTSKLRFVSPRQKSEGGHEWAVKLAGAKRAAAVVDSKAEAMQIARDLAKRNGEELIAQRLDGKIHVKNSYGPDPSNIPG